MTVLMGAARPCRRGALRAGCVTGRLGVARLTCFVALLSLMAPIAQGTRVSGSVSVTGPPDGCALAFVDDFAVAGDGSGFPVAFVDYSILVSRPVVAVVMVMSEAAFRQARDPMCNQTCKTAYAVAAVPLPAGDTEHTGRISLRNEGPPTFFYTVAPACNETVEFSYDVHITFAQTSYQEIPYSAVGIVDLYIVAFAAAIVLLIALIVAQEWLYASHWASTPIPVKLFALSCLLWGADVLFVMIHWTEYTSNGVGNTVVEGIGRVSDAFARLVAAITLLMLSKGWQLSPALTGVYTPAVSMLARLVTAVAVCVLGTLYIALAGWYLQDRDVTSTVYVYDSPPGLAICVLYVLLALWFGFDCSMAFMRTASPELRRYYLVLGAVYVPYLFVVPVAVFVGVSCPDYEDERVVELTVQVASIVFYWLTAFLVRPTVSTHYFIPAMPDITIVAEEESEQTPLFGAKYRRAAHGLSSAEQAGDGTEDLSLAFAAAPTLSEPPFDPFGAPITDTASSSRFVSTFPTPGVVSVLPTIHEVASPGRSTLRSGVSRSASADSGGSRSADSADDVSAPPPLHLSPAPVASPRVTRTSYSPASPQLRIRASDFTAGSPRAAAAAASPSSTTPRVMSRTGIIPADALQGVTLEEYMSQRSPRTDRPRPKTLSSLDRRKGGP